MIIHKAIGTYMSSTYVFLFHDFVNEVQQNDVRSFSFNLSMFQKKTFLPFDDRSLLKCHKCRAALAHNF